MKIEGLGSNRESKTEVGGMPQGGSVSVSSVVSTNLRKTLPCAWGRWTVEMQQGKVQKKLLKNRERTQDVYENKEA